MCNSSLLSTADKLQLGRQLTENRSVQAPSEPWCPTILSTCTTLLIVLSDVLGTLSRCATCRAAGGLLGLRCIISVRVSPTAWPCWRRKGRSPPARPSCGCSSAGSSSAYIAVLDRCRYIARHAQRKEYQAIKLAARSLNASLLQLWSLSKQLQPNWLHSGLQI